MRDYARPHDSVLERALWRLYRGFFDQAERRRRWSIERDIPWGQCNKGPAPAIADVVESFRAVELYLPDYLAQVMPWSRPTLEQLRRVIHGFAMPRNLWPGRQAATRGTHQGVGNL